MPLLPQHTNPSHKSNMDSSSSENNDKNDYIVMLPLLAQGHLIPFLALAAKLHLRTGFHVTIATSPLNARYLRSSLPSRHRDVIHVHDLDFNSPHENTENLPLEQIGLSFASTRQLESPTRRLLADLASRHAKPPICLVSYIFFGWAVHVAQSYKTVNVAFSTSGAYGSAAYLSFWQNLPHRCVSGDDDEEFHLPGFPERCRLTPSHLHRFLRAADGTDTWSKYFQPQIAMALKSFGVICNTVEEIEPFGLEVLRNYVKCRVWSVLACNISGAKYSGKESGVSAEKCMNWLDSKGANSVVYVSFGSQNTISAVQMMELARGLEMSRRPFVWVIRPPVGHDMKGVFKPEWLPEGFEERMSETKQGLLVRGWAPQVDILSHKATGVFVSHCGWNSVVESLSRGVPIIGWPLAAEQVYNSKMMVEEMGVNMELTRGVASDVVAEDVRRVIEVVMDESGEGGEMRKRAGEIGEKIRGAAGEDGEAKGSSAEAIDDLVNPLLLERVKREKSSNSLFK